MKVGILGGTFDPPHLGHLLLAQTAYDQLKLNTVLFVPAGDPPHKQRISKTPAHHRREMVERAIANNPNFQLNSVDLERSGPHYTTATVRLLRQQYNLSAEECFFIIGGDSLIDLPLWHNASTLITLCRLAVSHRPGYQPDLTALETQLPNLSQRLDWVEMPALGLESSIIRKQARAGRSLRYQVSESVRDYINDHHLYRGEEELCSVT